MTSVNAALDFVNLLPWWTHWLSGFAAVVGVLLRFRWLLAFIPVAGPVLLAVADAAVRLLGLITRKLLVPYVKLLGLGIYRACTSPAGITVAVTGAMVFVLVGIIIGVRLDAKLVRQANAERARLAIELATARTEINQWKGRLDAQQARATEADAARKAAEEKADAAERARTRAQRLLNAASRDAKAGSKSASGSCLFGLAALCGQGG